MQSGPKRNSSKHYHFMKFSIKNKSNTILASILVASFLLLHFYVYEGLAPTTIPILQSYTDSPVELPKLVLCEEKRPSYFNPFKKVEFHYQVEQNNEYSECNIVEQAESILTSKMKPLVGNPLDYWKSFEKNGFARPNIGYVYANISFFLLQYLIILSFVFVLLKPIDSKK